ncbi:MAG: hypothetical protein Q7O12_08635 [Deltaproteobacteria bacterium]|nr:hypothetical protein [Deltaproteobacteria bacterium]
MRTTGIVAALLLAVSLLTPGQGWGDELSESYFPLKAGMRWEYNIISDQGATKKLLITNLAPREVSGTKVTPRKRELGGTTFIELMKQDETGTYRYAEQAGEKAPPTLVTPMECHLKFPVAEGSSWNMAAKLGNSTVNLSLTIESLSDEVKVPAGTFKDCLKIKQVGENDAGTSVMGYEWYAPKVGVVKSLVTIRQKSKAGPKSETRTYQLVSFRP